MLMYEFKVGTSCSGGDSDLIFAVVSFHKHPPALLFGKVAFPEGLSAFFLSLCRIFIFSSFFVFSYQF